MPPSRSERSRRTDGKCCPHCDRKWNNKNGKYRAVPDLDKLYLHFIHLQQICTRALAFARNNNRPSDFKYLFEDKKSADKKTERTRMAKRSNEDVAETPKPVAATKTEVRTITIGGKTYRIMRDVKIDLPPPSSDDLKRKEPETSADEPDSKRVKMDDVAPEDEESSKKEEAETKDAKEDEQSVMDNDLRMSLMAVMNGEEPINPSPQFEMAKRMWKVVMDQMMETEQKGKMDKKEEVAGDEKKDEVDACKDDEIVVQVKQE